LLWLFKPTGASLPHSTSHLTSLQPRFLVDEGIQSDDDGGGNYTLYSIVLCENLVRLLYPENFDDCGMVVPTSRGEECLGDDTVRPSDYWGSGEEGALNFLNDETGGKPPLFSDDDGVKFRVIVSLCLPPSLTPPPPPQIDYSNGDSCYKSSGHRLSLRLDWTLSLALLFMTFLFSYS
jgi:hypothetical protein